ncbi:MAG: 3-deoxy-manno-octulosonate cytidylyltransferase [bacterium]
MKKKRLVVVIPARMAASRFPGKPLAKILDLPLVEHVRRRVQLSDVVDDVYVATCDQEIMDEVKGFGGQAIMTANTHERCTDRVEEAVKNIKADIVVIVQGDEPLFMPEVVAHIAQPLIDDDTIQCTSLLSEIKNKEDLKDIDIVKAVVSSNNDVLYFSRSPIPYFRVEAPCPMYRQTGISAFTKDFLIKFTNMAPTPLEVVESVDFLRILQHGHKIRGVVISQETFGVDRPDDVGVIENVLRKDKVQRDYYERILKL